MDKTTSEVGAAGERFIVKYLEKNGYEILERNYRFRRNEIDIIAKKDRYIAFVEVKARRQNPYFSPAQAVTKDKQKRIMNAAYAYMLSHKSGLQPRFDVAEVIIDPVKLKSVSINYIKNAFWQEGQQYARF